MSFRLFKNENQKKPIVALQSSARSMVFSSETGFSLVELLAAVTIFIVCIGAAYGLLEVARASRTTVNQQVQTMQAARSALNAMGRDILNAGSGDFRQSGNGALLKNGALSNLLGIPFVAADFDRLSTIVPGDNLTQNNLSGNYTDQITLLYQDITLNSNQSLNVLPNGVYPVGGFVNINPNKSNCNVNDLIIVSGSTVSAIGMITNVAAGNSGGLTPGDTAFFKTGDPLGFNNSYQNGPIAQIRNQPASFTRVTLVTYRVLSDGTLVRTLYGNNPNGTTRESQIQDSPLVQNVENMQIEYVLADGSISSNPTVDSSSMTPLSPSQAAANMQSVRQVRISLTLRSSQKDMRNNQPIKLTLSSTFGTRNLSYQR